MTVTRRGVLLAASLLVLTARAQAQTPIHLAPEARIDGILARHSALQGTLGADIFLSPELGIEIAGGLGASSYGDEQSGHLSGRADAIVRFLLDPRHAMKWSPYGGGGIGARYDRGPGWRGVAILVVGASGPKWGKSNPFFEAGFGGGARIGFGIRGIPGGTTSR